MISRQLSHKFAMKGKILEESIPARRPRHPPGVEGLMNDAECCCAAAIDWSVMPCPELNLRVLCSQSTFGRW
jgi:hypothetical protein